MNDIPNVNPSIETLRTDLTTATNFVESFFSGKQQRNIKDDEERRDMLKKLMVAQKTVDDANRGDSIKSITDTINNHNKVYTDKHVLPSELFSNDELIAAVKAIEGIEVKALFSDEELASAGYTQKGNTQTRTGGSTEKEMITTQIVDLKGAVVSVTVGKRGAVAKPKEGEATDIYDFFQEVSRLNEGKATKDKITKESLSKSSPAEIAETFADYIAKVKAQAA
ncbi:hypothetical protein U1438_15380 [Aeromonas caviae]|uniref:hypothetical protein n=1 Tax=Aeromonas caviae TaxID=648 RepID=UPI003014DEF9